MFQRSPYLSCEPLPLCSFRFLGTFSTHNFQNDCSIFTRVKRHPPAENFIYDHSKCIAIGFPRGATIRKPKRLRMEEFRAHPSDGASSAGRGCNGPLFWGKQGKVG